MNNTKKDNKRQNLISGLVLVIGTVLSFLFFGPEKIKSQENKTALSDLPAISVKAVIAGSEETKTASITKSAQVFSSASAEIIAEYTGKITNVKIETGSHVKKGEVIAEFDQTDNPSLSALESNNSALNLAQRNFEEAEKAAKESLELAKNARKIAEIQLKKEKGEDDNSDNIRLAERSLKNAKDLEDQAAIQAELQINSAKLQVTQALGAREQSHIAYQKTIIRAPISGIVTEKNVSRGDFVSFGNKIAQITGSGNLEISLSLSSNQIKRIKQGDPVSIILGEKTYQGEIQAFSSLAQTGNQRFDVKIGVKDFPAEIINKYVAVNLNLRLDQEAPNSFFIPLSAVNIGQEKSVLFVVENNFAKRTEIKVGEVIGDKIEITEGLKGGEMVIVENSRSVQDGRAVKLAPKSN